MTDIDPGTAAIVKAGRLRIGLFPSFFYTKDRATGELSGWGIEMARALAGRLGVELQLIERVDPSDVVAGLVAGDYDAAFLGISPERGRHVDFTPPWLQADLTFLVPQVSDIRRIDDADRAGVRIGVVANHAMEIALKGKLPLAKRVYAETPEAAFALLLKGEIEVLAGIRPGLMAFAATAPGMRVLADRYGANTLGLAVRKGEPAWHAFVCAFVAESKTTGSAKAAAEHVGAQGLDVVA